MSIDDDIARPATNMLVSCLVILLYVTQRYGLRTWFVYAITCSSYMSLMPCKCENHQHFAVDTRLPPYVTTRTKSNSNIIIQASD